MKFKILGSGSGFPEVDKNNPSIWIQSDNHNFIFDAGDGLAHRLLENNLSKDVIDAIIISHFHPDHVAGIFLAIQLLHVEKRDKPLKIFIPEQIDKFREMLDLFYLFPENLSFNLEVFDISELEKIYYNIVPFQSTHLKRYAKIIRDNELENEMKSYSFVIEEGKKNMIYTSDIVNIEHLKNEIPNASYIIIDGLHTDIEDFSNILENMNAQIIVTHGISESVQSFMKDEQSSRLCLADEGKTIEF